MCNALLPSLTAVADNHILDRTYQFYHAHSFLFSSFFVIFCFCSTWYTELATCQLFTARNIIRTDGRGTVDNAATREGPRIPLVH